MSDMGLGYDPFTDMGEDDLIAMYAGMNPQLYGENPAKRLNYYQDLAQTLGFDLVQLAGVDNPAQQVPQWQEPINQTAQMYGSDPFFASIFQAIENGADPISATRAARDQLGMPEGMTQDDFNQTILPIATQYAGERVKTQQARMDWERENADKIGGWTAPDGSKYKQSPMGGNDIRATASEFDLIGAPSVEDLISQYAKDRNPANRIRPGAGVSASGGDFQARGAGWSLPAQAAGATQPRSATKPKGNFSSNPLVEKYAMQEAKGDAQRYIDKTKNTRVRSDANINAMRRITALAGLLQGGFPE